MQNFKYHSSKKIPSPFGEGGRKRGSDQIRTGVEAFAELCLATRPQNLIQYCKCLLQKLFKRRTNSKY